jgi:hypothetical protein
MLEPVYQQMRHHFKDHETMDCLFETVEDIEDKEIKQHLTKIYRDYQTAKKKGKEIDFFFQTQDALWEQAREKVNGEKRPHLFLDPKEMISLTS